METLSHYVNFPFNILSRRPIALLIRGSDEKSDEKSGSGRTCIGGK